MSLKTFLCPEMARPSLTAPRRSGRRVGGHQSILLALIFAATLSAHIVGQESGARVLAEVGGMPITVADVDFQLGRAAAGSVNDQELPPTIRNSTIALIGLQRQALATLRKSKQAASNAAVERWLEANPPATEDPSVKLKASQIIGAVCEQAGITEAAYRDFIAFRLSWPPYLKKHLTEANVEKHFRNQAARFDGSQFEVEVASLAAAAGQSPARSDAEAKLQQVREQVSKDETDLSAASADISEIEFRPRGWIRGTGDLDPALVDAVLALEDGQLSEPIHTATGVHLVSLHATKPGDLSLDAVRDDVRAHMLLFLLKHLASLSEGDMPLTSKM